MRKNNKSEMTIAEQLNAIADDFCKNYCKYSDAQDEKKEGCEHCKNCPLGELI